jgi:hypothetical protein
MSHNAGSPQNPNHTPAQKREASPRPAPPKKTPQVSLTDVEKERADWEGMTPEKPDQKPEP